MGFATVERPPVGPADRDRAGVVEAVVPLDDHAVNEERLEDQWLRAFLSFFSDISRRSVRLKLSK